MKYENKVFKIGLEMCYSVGKCLLNLNFILFGRMKAFTVIQVVLIHPINS
jgi:hypothetical protein